MKKRLDQILVEGQQAKDREEAGRLIRAGEVYVDEVLVDKPGFQVDVLAAIRLKKKCPYVSRGGIKLAHALPAFKVDVRGLVCLDVGASSGGFTDCLLQNGAAHVFAVDVAYGQLSWKIRQDRRVTVLERCNARGLSHQRLMDSWVDLAVMDVSFISLTKIIPALCGLFRQSVNIIALVKPQFELPRRDIGDKGVVTDPRLHQKAIDKVTSFVQGYDLTACNTVPSPILGPKGNREFFIHITSYSLKKNEAYS